jgi:cellulose synthase (UDP-forming)
VPYYVLYAWDLKMVGYRMTDIFRVYALNLVLIPVNLVGVGSSLQQAITGTKAAFGRTPKVRGRTGVPGIYLLAEYGILAQWLVGAVRDLVARHHLHAIFSGANVAFLVYGIVTFIGVRQSAGDLCAASPRSRTARRPPAIRRPTRCTPRPTRGALGERGVNSP